jgi:hypothetical protein
VSRAAIAAAGVALLVATAGCSGVLGGDGTPDREPYDVAPTPTPTATETAKPLRVATAFRAAVGNHSDALWATGNFTVRWWGWSGPMAESSRPTTVEAARVDLDAGRYAWGRGPPDGVGPFVAETYQNATGVYRRVTDGGTATFWDVTESIGPTAVTPRKAAVSVARFPAAQAVAIPFERDGRVTVGGERMVRYTADEPGGFRNWSTSIRTVTGFRATAVVDDRGVVRTFTYTLRGRSADGSTVVESQTVRIADVGETTVPWPAGLANATDVGEGPNPTGGTG